MIAEKRPADDSETWDILQAAIRARLGEVQKGTADNFCWISHEEVLDDNGTIVKGGLVVVAQKLKPFRINFYRMQQFRDWVAVRPLDIASNKYFADEKDVWVVRLIDKTASSRVPLPNLDISSAANGRQPADPRVAPSLEQRARAEVLNGSDFWEGFPVPRVGDECLIPNMVPRTDELFVFKFFWDHLFARMRHTWRWDLRSVRLGGVVPLNVSFRDAESMYDGRMFLQGTRPRFSMVSEWSVYDASNRVLFRIKSLEHRTSYMLVPPSGSGSLFTVHIDRSVRFGRPSMFHIVVRSGADNRTVYVGRTVIRRNRAHILYFNGDGSETNFQHVAEALSGDGTFGTYRDLQTFYAYASADAALLLVASTLAFI
eukprot:TRINITY_DN22473_c0_g5_i1.p1 TRINITY_DN22473_c0_g5~~TRINITY_DN22473_c0_g5_i1.p1  ORF type:complete len:372 (-),score=20.46 TRINITY_DN22473_c0_g5_i1:154-1269(-)